MKVPVRYLPRLIVVLMGATLATIVMLPLFFLVSIVTASPYPTYRLSRIWAWIVARCCGVTYSLHNREKALPGQSYIVCPNHQSHTDILALIQALPVRFRWVIKKEIVSIPGFGWGVVRTGAIVLDRSQKAEAFRKLKEGADKASGGWSILIYPEGTRSPDGRLLPFKKGGFLMAVNTGVPILPVTVNGAHKILPKKTLRLTPGHITVTLGDPIPTGNLTEKDIPELMARTQAAIEKYLDFNYDPFAKENRALARRHSNLSERQVAAEKT